MKKITGLMVGCILAFTANAQEFVTRAKIEFEKKERQAKGTYPEFSVSYFDLTFAGNQTLYKEGKQAGAKSMLPPGVTYFSSNRRADDAMFCNLTTGMRSTRKNLFNEEFVIEDSIPPIKWKIGQETRDIAGYQCRKAIGRIFDTVYVVAFYAEELVIKGGPEGFQGLPGMILGIAIPRYNTTWFATKIELANIDESKITAPTIKKKGDTKTRLLSKLKEYGSKNAAADAEEYLRSGYFLSDVDY